MESKQWSNEDILSEFESCNNLSEVIDSLEKEYWTKGRVVCEIRVNGVFLTEEDESRLGQENISAIERLEIKSRLPKELMMDAVQSYRELIPEIKNNVLDAAECYREMDVKRAQESFSSVLDACRWLTDALFLLKKNVRNWLRTDLDGEGWKTCEARYIEVIKEIMVAFEAKDYVLLSDLLEYELANSLDEWLIQLSSADKVLKN